MQLILHFKTIGPFKAIGQNRCQFADTFAIIISNVSSSMKTIVFDSNATEV